MLGAQKDYGFMSDQALQQALMFAQRSNNTPEFLGLMAEAQKRKQMRSEAQGMQAGQQLSQQRPATVADQVMQGIANLPSGEHEYAGGGIVSFDDGGTVMTDTKGDPYTHLWHAEGSTDKNTPYWDSMKETFGFPLEMLKKVIGAPNQRKYREETPPAAPKQATPPPPSRAGAGRGAVNPDAVVPQQGAAQVAPTSPGGIGSLSTASKSKTVAPAAETAVAVEKTMTPEELRAKAEAMAKGDNDKVAAIYAKAAERDAKRREALEAETKGTKGWLGAEMSPETRKMLRDAGIAMLTSKRSDALGGIGEGLAAASKGYEEGKQRRQDRLDLLDAADEKRQLAQIAAQQGNMELSRKYITEAETLKQQAESNAMKRQEMADTKDYRNRSLALQAEQNRVSAANAGRNPQLELYKALGGGDPRKGYEFAYGTRGGIMDVNKAQAQYTKLRNSGDPQASAMDFQTWFALQSGSTASAPSTAGYTVQRQ